MKCRAELRAGNQEFEHAAQQIEQRLREELLPEVDYFLDVFAPGYDMSLDNLLK
jgi:5'-deoxynucleotidase